MELGLVLAHYEGILCTVEFTDCPRAHWCVPAVPRPSGVQGKAGGVGAIETCLYYCQ